MKKIEKLIVRKKSENFLCALDTIVKGGENEQRSGSSRVVENEVKFGYLQLGEMVD